MTKPVNRVKLEAMLLKWLAMGTRSAEITPGARSSVDLIDQEQQRSLELDLGLDAMVDLKTNFWADAELMLKALRAEFEAKDGHGVDTTLHTLKGAAQTLGYAALGEEAETVRRCGADLDNIETLERIARKTCKADPGRHAWAEAA